jgi:DMSO/TMAO reductase YedYZ molybdopterin-dependent catalytic subunit
VAHPAHALNDGIGRRAFLSGALLLPTLFTQTSSARLAGVVPLGNPGGLPTPPFGRLLGSGLDARLFTDLSLPGESSGTSAWVTPTDRFFVRTASPSAIARAGPWTVRIAGLAGAPAVLTVRELESMSGGGGRYLLECSGNVNQTNYGLMSAADWEGVPLAAILDRIAPAGGASRVLVSGVDDEESAARTSAPGASWIFSRDDLGGALLALRMNGAPLTRDHGAPVRLIVPGWYGCACIKWVDRIELVPDAAPATAQMREFAARTHQPFDSRAIERSLTAGSPLPARDFIPAVIDTAAMPVRVEKWIVDGRVAYRIAGIIWGGSRPTNALSIRFRSGQPWVKVEDCPLPASTLTWSPWTHTWRPEAPGRYQIVLRVDDPTIRTRRLDLFFYVREIYIDDV